MVNKTTVRQSASVGGCLICSEQVREKEPFDGNEAVGMQRLEKAMRKVFKYLLVPEKSWEVLGANILAGVPFCSPCYEAVEDIMNLQKQKDAMELKIQNKAEGLGKVVGSTPPHLFLTNGFGGSGSGSQQKQFLEMWKYFRDPVMQNFAKGMLPNPCVKMHMLSPGENEKYGNVATTARVKLSELSKEGEDVVGMNEDEINGPSMSPVAAEKKGQLKFKIRMVAQKQVKKGRVNKRKRPIAIKRKVLPRKKIQKIKMRLVEPRSRPMMNEDKREEMAEIENDEDDETENHSSDESDLENLFEEIVVTRGYDGGIRSLSPVSPSKSDSSQYEEKPKGLLSASNAVSSESSTNSSIMSKPVVVSKSGIKMRLKDAEATGGSKTTSTSATVDRDCDDSTSEVMELEVERSSPVPVANLKNRVAIPSKENGNKIEENAVWNRNILHQTETSEVEINRDRFTAASYLPETAIPEGIKSPTADRSPCVPVSRCDQMEILAPTLNNDDDERSHSQELMEMMFSPPTGDEELLTPNCDGADGGIDAIIIPPMHFSPTHFGVDLNSYIVDNDLHCSMD